MYITNTITNIKTPVTNSGFSAITITLPKIQKGIKKDFFTLPVPNKEQTPIPNKEQTPTL